MKILVKAVIHFPSHDSSVTEDYFLAEITEEKGYQEVDPTSFVLVINRVVGMDLWNKPSTLRVEATHYKYSFVACLEEFIKTVTQVADSVELCSIDT